MVFDAFRARNTHRATAATTPLWRRGAAALAVGAILGTASVAGAGAFDTPFVSAASAADSTSPLTPINADAIESGYISKTVDTTNARGVLSGTAQVVNNNGNPSTFQSNNFPVPDGTTVYLRWFDKDGAVSPVYTAKTTSGLIPTVTALQVAPTRSTFASTRRASLKRTPRVRSWRAGRITPANATPTPHLPVSTTVFGSPNTRIPKLATP